jgi:tryptophan synthase beta chain
MIGVEAAGHGLETGQHAASLTAGHVGVLHGNKTYLLQSETGQVQIAHSISAGLDYPAVGPEHSYLRDSGRVTYETIGDEAAVTALRTLAEQEGIICALESAHAIAAAMRLAPTLPRRAVVLVNLSGRGDKDMETVADYLGIRLREPAEARA